MNLLFSCIGKRGYIAEMFRQHLGKSDRIIGTSNTPWTSGFHVCDAGYLMPPIQDPAYPEAVIELCRREHITALLSFFDMDVHRLSRYVEDFRSIGVIPFIPDARASDITFDKVMTYEFLKGQGIATARTYTSLDQTREALRTNEVCFPLYVKPRAGFGSRNTFQASDERQLEVFFSLEPEMIAQETLRGDAYDFDILNDLDGRVLSIVPWRKLSSRMGETERSETVESPLLLDLGKRLAEALGHSGPLDADLFVDQGKAFVLEINLRFGGGYPVSHLAGAGFPEMIVRIARGERVEPVIGKYDKGVAMMKELHVIGGVHNNFFQNILKVRNDVLADKG